MRPDLCPVHRGQGEPRRPDPYPIDLEKGAPMRPDLYLARRGHGKLIRPIQRGQRAPTRPGYRGWSNHKWMRGIR